MKAIYKLHYDCGRMGTLFGVFVADTEAMKALIEARTEIYFGEVLGKHSEICGPLDDCDFTLVTTDPIAVQMFETYDLESGFNPFDYLPESNEENN